MLEYKYSNRLDNFSSKTGCNGLSKAIITTLSSCELIRKNKVTTSRHLANTEQIARPESFQDFSCNLSLRVKVTKPIQRNQRNPRNPSQSKEIQANPSESMQIQADPSKSDQIQANLSNYEQIGANQVKSRQIRVNRGKF